MTAPFPANGLLIVCRHSAWQASSAAALEVALTGGVFELPVTLVLLDEAVLQLKPGQDGAVLALKACAKQLPALELFGVTQVYADSAAAARFSVELGTAELPVQPFAPAQLAALVAGHRSVLVF